MKRKKDSNQLRSGIDGGKKRKESEQLPVERSLSPYERTLVEGPLGDKYAFLLADRLQTVAKLKDDTVFYGRFKRETYGYLGEGTFGQVWKVKDSKANDRIYAVKIVDKDRLFKHHPDPFYKMAMYCEAAAFMEILPKHPNLINMYAILESPKHVYYLMECLAKFDLNETFAGFTSAQSRRCFYRILHAVDHLHQHGIWHSDLKLDNICLREDDRTNPIVIDLGCCQYNGDLVRKIKPSFKEEAVFTPEELKSMKEKDWKVDLHGLCTILGELLIGRIRPSISNDVKPSTHPDAKALLEFMMDTEKLHQSTAEQLMEHPWFEPERAGRPIPPTAQRHEAAGPSAAGGTGTAPSSHRRRVRGSFHSQPPDP